MHLTDEQVQRHVHNEDTTQGTAAVAIHLAECTACRQLVQAAGDEDKRVNQLLSVLDQPLPAMRAAQLIARARRPNPLVRVAATIAVAVGLTGVVWAAPGSPLKAWVNSRLATTDVNRAPSGPLPRAPEDVVPLDSSGIAVDAGAPLVIRFARAQTEGTVLLSIDDGRLITVQSAAGAARFSSAVGRLDVENAGAVVDFVIRIPRSAPRVAIEVAGTTLAVVRLGHVEGARAVGAESQWRLPLSERP